MKNIKQIRENFDLITEKEEKEDRKLSALVRAGLYDAKKLPALKKALEKSADKMTAQEKRMLLNLLDSLIAQVTSDEQIYRKVKQNVHSMNEAKEDYLSKFDPRFKSGYPSDKDIPTVIILKRKAIRVYPDNQKVALYYSQSLDKYVTIPFSDIQTGLNEAVKPDQKDEKDKKNPNFKLKPKTSSGFKQEKEKKETKKKDDEFSSVKTRAIALRDRGVNVGGTIGTIWHDIAKGKFKKKSGETPSEPKKSEPKAQPKTPAAKPKAQAKKPTAKPAAKPAKPLKVKSAAATRAAAAAIKKKNPNVQFSQAAKKRGNLAESFVNKLQMIREDVADYLDQEYYRRGIQPPPLGAAGGGGRGGRGSATARQLSTKRYTGSGERLNNSDRRSFARQSIARRNPVVRTRPDVPVGRMPAAKKIEPRQDRAPVGTTSRSAYPQQNITSKNPVVKTRPDVPVGRMPKARKPEPARPEARPGPETKPQTRSVDTKEVKRPASQNAAAEKAVEKANRASRLRDEKSLRNRETRQGKKPQSKFGAALAAAAAGGAALLGAAGVGSENPTGVSHKFVKKAETKDSWALQQKDLPDTQRRRLQQANRRALEMTNENVVSILKNMVNNGVTEQTVTINEQEININNTVAKKIVLVYESVNEDNKKKMEQMLNESATSFNKVLTFALRQ